MTFLNAPNDTERSAVAATVQSYIDGYLGQETGKLRQAFHADSKLMTTDEGAVSATATAAWFDKIDGKTAEQRKPLQAKHKILGIDLSTSAAVAKVHLDFGTYEFTDYLSLLKTKAGWSIVNKIYAVTELA